MLIELRIGEAGDAATSDYQVVIATPEGLRKRDDRMVITDRGCIVISDFTSWADLKVMLQEIVDRCAAVTATESSERMRYFFWEDEDHERPRSAPSSPR